jgi:hypothetical protein
MARRRLPGLAIVGTIFLAGAADGNVVHYVGESPSDDPLPEMLDADCWEYGSGKSI